MALKDFIRKMVPKQLLDWNRARKKDAQRLILAAQRDAGNVLTKEILVEQFKKIGLKSGDHVMVHSAMSKIGFLENGPKTFVDALLEVVGKKGTVCMPSSPVKTLQLEHMQNAPVFDVKNTPSAMGAITEYFRQLPQTRRSLHPTEPVCANGLLADEFVKGHFSELTPYTAKSPWKKLMDAGGKILYVGVTLDNAGTHLHTLEDALPFKFPVYASEIFNAICVDENGLEKMMTTKVHNPEFSNKRKCDALIPYFEKKGVLSKHQLGNAAVLFLDAKSMFEAMVAGYQKDGITMYTPNGEKIAGYDK
jgi:aminoglycoside 3-N-acetyltransferase